MRSVLFWGSMLLKIPKERRSEVYVFAFCVPKFKSHLYIVEYNGIVISKEFRRMWKEAVETYFKTLF